VRRPFPPVSRPAAVRRKRRRQASGLGRVDWRASVLRLLTFYSNILEPHAFTFSFRESFGDAVSSPFSHALAKVHVGAFYESADKRNDNSPNVKTRRLTHLETIFWQVKNLRTMTSKLAYDYDVVIIPVP
jgi:hypothetical protein